MSTVLPGVQTAGPVRVRRAASPRAYVLTAIATLLVLWAALFALPDDPYRSYSSAADTDYIKSRWIYERLNFDPTPVDVAFLGSSRTMEGVNSAQIEERLHALTGQTVHVVNLSLPHLGRDVPYLLMRMLLETKHPRLILTEVDFLPTRDGHPIFPLLASARDVLDAPLLVNEKLPQDLLRLPLRTLTQWRDRIGAAIAPDLFPPVAFDRSSYRGPHWDDTFQATELRGRLSPPRTAHMSLDAFERLSGQWVATDQRNAAEYPLWGWLKLRYNDIFQQRMLKLAHDSSVPLVMLYQPAVGSAAEPFQADRLRRFGPIWPVPAGIADDYTLWDNPTHMNTFGAHEYSDWLAPRIAGALGYSPK